MTPKPSSTIELLAELYPQTFVAERWKPHRPLKCGIHLDLAERGTPVHGRVLNYYTWLRMYLKAIVEGATRYDLDGQPAGVVTAEEATEAVRRLAVLTRRALENSGKPLPAKPEPAPAPEPPKRLSLSDLKAAAQARKASAEARP
jgi:ProP effector